MDIQFGVQTYKSESTEISSERCVNFYAERQTPTAKTQIALFGCPGIEDHATCGTGPVRGMHEMNDMLHVVSGPFLYSVAESGQVTSLGGQISGTGPVDMDDNGDQLCIVNGTNGYIYDATAGFQLISDSDFHAANSTAFIDSFFAFDRAGTNEYFISDSLAGTVYSDLFGSAESRPDNVLSVLNHLEVLYVLGTKTIELHQNAGAANFPFQRIPGGIIPRGIAAPLARATEDSAIFVLGEDRIAYRINGSQLVKISTPAIDAAWQKYETVDDCHAFSYTYSGHKFVHFNFPTANKTWVWDISTGLWHERESYDRTGNALGRWRGNCAAPAYGKIFIGDLYTGKVGFLSGSTFTEFGDQTRGEVVSPPIHGGGKRIFMPWFELEVATGVGLTNGQGSDPQYMLEISDDGGRTFDAPQAWGSAGKLGEYGSNRTQLRWDRLGQSFGRSIRVSCTDPVQRVIHKARCPDLRLGL